MAQKKKKKTAARKKSRGKRAPARGRQTTLSDLIARNEVKATLIFVAGLVLLFVAIFGGAEGSFWNSVHRFYYSLFSIVGFLLPMMLLFLGVVRVLNKQKRSYGVKILQIFIFVALVCGMFHIGVFADAETGYFEAVGNVFREGMTPEGRPVVSGGVVGALVGGLFFQLGKSQVIAFILTVVCILADLMFLFHITLFHVFSRMEEPAKKVGQYTGDVIENAKSDFERRKKENAENREIRRETKKRSNMNVDPARIVDDYLEHNPEDPKPVSQEEAHQNDDIVSIFDRVNRRFEAQQTQETQQTEEAAPAEPFVFEDLNVPETEAAPAEKAEPLSEQEAAALNGELQEALETAPVPEYHLPPLECLNPPQRGAKNYDPEELRANGEKLIAALNSFNVSASIVDVVPGPTVTRYELSPAPGVKISKFTGLSDDLALHLAAPAGLRIEAPIPNKAAIGIEIPNKKKTSVTFREVIDVEEFRAAKSRLNVALGKDISGDVIFCDIATMPHLLVAGTTGSGKSICLHTMIVSILYKATPEEVKLLLIDPKTVEFSRYNGIPHLLVPVVSDPRKASGALAWAVTEMLNRYKTLNENGARDIASYNSLCDEREDLKKMPQIVIVMDELADLMTVAPAEVEDSIQRIAQMGRAAGVHLVVATQRPSVDVITGVIKANIPSRIALTVKSQIDSRTMIDQGGAEKLMGKGDMLYFPVSVPKPIRVQGAFISPSELENVVNFIRSNGTAQYDDTVQSEIERQAAADKKKGAGDEKASGGVDKNDDLTMRAIELFVNTPEKASISALQRHLGLGFAKAGRLMDSLEEQGIVGPAEGSKPRKVLLTKAQWYEMSAMGGEVHTPEAVQALDGDPASYGGSAL